MARHIMILKTTKTTIPINRAPRKTNHDRNSAQGRINRANGRAFEDRIDAAMAEYKRRGIALIDKTPEPMRIIQRLDGGKFVGVFAKKAQPDYKGVKKGGKTMIFEAKYTSGDRLQKSAVTDSQYEYMIRASNLGAECFILAGFKTGNAYRIPFRVWYHMEQTFGRKYIREDDVEEYKINILPYGPLDILMEGN